MSTRRQTLQTKKRPPCQSCRARVAEASNTQCATASPSDTSSGTPNEAKKRKGDTQPSKGEYNVSHSSRDCRAR
eukprot:9135211-Pyramimonas_sp.AAC.1